MKLARCIAIAVLLFGSLSTLASAQTIRTVALTGDPVPSATDGAIFSSFDFPVLDAQGKATFHAVLESGIGEPISNLTGIWSESSGTLAKVVRRGDQASGAPTGVTYSSFEPPVVSATGEVAFAATLTGTGVVSNVNDKGIWTGTADSLAKVTRSGDQIPNAPIGLNFGSARFALAFQQTSSGELTFQTSLAGTGIDSTNFSAIWRYSDGALSKIVQRGDQAPGLPSGVVFSEFYQRFSNSSDGNSTFHATLSGPGVDNSNSQGVWSETDGSMRLVARTGDQVQGMPNGVVYKYINPWGNNLGKTVFGATLEGPGLTDSTSGIWLEEAGSLIPIVLDGDPAPSLPEGTIIYSPSPLVKQSDNNVLGQVSFHTSFSGGSGFWTGGPEDLSLIARDGENAPGTTGDINFLLGMGHSVSPALNNEGNIAFYARLIGADVNRNNFAGIWAQDPYGELRLVIQHGDQLEVAPGDFRMVRGVGLVRPYTSSDGTFDNRSASDAFNDSNQLAFWAEFEGGSGIFVSTFNAIPEPSTFFLAALSVVGILINRRR